MLFSIHLKAHILSLFLIAKVYKLFFLILCWMGRQNWIGFFKCRIYIHFPTHYWWVYLCKQWGLFLHYFAIWILYRNLHMTVIFFSLSWQTDRSFKLLRCFRCSQQLRIFHAFRSHKKTKYFLNRLCLMKTNDAMPIAEAKQILVIS